MKRKRQAKSSYKVFIEYVVFEKDCSSADVSKIFSRECFLDWLATRPCKNVKHPANSFQRVLYAHIRGADKRRCFPEIVEKELLRILRDKNNNPWKILFDGEPVAYGKRGFRSRGYHETKQWKKLNQEQAIGEVLGHEVDAMGNNPLFASSKDNEGKNLLRNENVGLNDAGRLNSKKKNDLMTDVSGRFWNPSVHERFFSSSRPIGTMVFTKSGKITHEDDSLVEMFKGSLCGKDFFEIFPSTIAVGYPEFWNYPHLKKNEIVWRRCILQRKDSVRIVCLFYVFNTGKELIASFQNQSQFFPKALTNAFLL